MKFTITQLGDHRALFKRAVRAHQEVIEVYEELVMAIGKSDQDFVESAKRCLLAERTAQSACLTNVQTVANIIKRVERELNGYRNKDS